MPWMSLLYQTYESNKSLAGKSGENVPLSVIAHMTANAQIEITLDQNGNFQGAAVVAKDESKTLIPVTESSEGRANGIAPHALCDTLSYIAGDFAQCAADEKAAKLSANKFAAYETALRAWVDSPYRHPKCKAVYRYIEKKCMIHDLASCGIVHLDKEEKLTSDKVSGQPYEKALVRFIIQTGEVGEPKETWKDQTLFNRYTNYYLDNQKGTKDICYLTGEYKTITQNHPKGIVSSNYGAKLISSNDKRNFVFRGRFLTAGEACTVSYEASQKAHDALTWLVAKQGISIGNKEKRTFICWNPNGKEIPNLEDAFDMEAREEAVDHTEPEYKERLRKAFNGYIESIENNENIVIMGLDAATTGRLSITYFNELTASDYFDRLKKWASSCTWYFTIFTTGKKPVETIKTPTVNQIVTCAFGTERESNNNVNHKVIKANDKVLKEQSQRVYHCMLDSQPLPKDLVHAAFIKASTPTAYTYGNHERVLSVACALIMKYYNDKKGGSIKMELDGTNRNRSYLFGRLLAIAEKVEKSTYKKEESRTTNAIRLQTAFVNHPLRTWGVLESALIPYYQKLTAASAEFYKKQMEDIVGLLQEQDQNILNKPLEESYLIGYYVQRKALRFKGNETENSSEGEIENEHIAKQN